MERRSTILRSQHHPLVLMDYVVSNNFTFTGLRVATVDNYQGEESDIVIACLTRSNDKGDIGFMFAPQRVNVLLSRAC